jgi:hypothetical protein
MKGMINASHRINGPELSRRVSAGSAEELKKVRRFRNGIFLSFFLSLPVYFVLSFFTGMFLSFFLYPGTKMRLSLPSQPHI